MFSQTTPINNNSNNTSTLSSSSVGSQIDNKAIQIAKLQAKANWIKAYSNLFNDRLAKHASPIYDYDLFLILIPTIYRTFAAYQKAELHDHNLAKDLFISYQELLKHLIVGFSAGRQYLIEKTAIANNLNIYYFLEYHITRTTLDSINLFPTHQDQLLENLNNIDESLNIWNAFYQKSLKEITQALPICDDLIKFNADLPKKIANIKASYHFNFARHALQQNDPTMVIDANRSRAKKSLYLAKKHATIFLELLTHDAQGPKILKREISYAKKLLQKINNFSINNTNQSKLLLSQPTPSSTLQVLNQINNAKLLDTSIQKSELNFFNFNEVKLSNNTNAKIKTIIAFDIDETLALFYDNGTYRIIAENNLIYLLQNLDLNSTKVVAITARYFPEKIGVNDVSVFAVDLIKAIESKVGKQIFSSIFYTSANDKNYALQNLQQFHFFHDLNNNKNNIILIDDAKINLDRAKAAGYQVIETQSSGGHLYQLAKLMNINLTRYQNPFNMANRVLSGSMPASNLLFSANSQVNNTASSPIIHSPKPGYP